MYQMVLIGCANILNYSTQTLKLYGIHQFTQPSPGWQQHEEEREKVRGRGRHYGKRLQKQTEGAPKSAESRLLLNSIISQSGWLQTCFVADFPLNIPTDSYRAGSMNKTKVLFKKVNAANVQRCPLKNTSLNQIHFSNYDFYIVH